MPVDSLAPSPIEDELLRPLVPVGSLPSASRKALASRAMVYDLVAGGRIEGGDGEMAGSLYLVRGRATLCARDKAPVHLEAGTDTACSALFGLAEDGAYVEAEDDCQLLQVDSTLLASMLICVAAGAEIADEPWLPRVLASEPFSRLPPAGLHRLGSRLQRVCLDAGQYVVRQGQPADYYYLLASGRCAVEWRSGADEEAVQLAAVEPGEGFGEEALLGEMPRATSVRTQKPCVLFRLTRDDLEQLMRSPPIARCAPEDAVKRVADGAYWLDVRLPQEHGHGAPAGSVNVPLGALDAAMEWLDRDSEWIVCCNTGLRSEAAVAVLTERGYRARQLDGGLFNRERRGGEEIALGELQRRRAHADAEVESALHETAVAEAAVVMPGVVEESDATPEPSPELQEAARRARERLEEAIRSKLELDTRARHLEAEISARRERALAEAARMRHETGLRLRRERDRLSNEVAEAAAAMQALRTERKSAEEKFAQEQLALNERMQRARQELDAQARRIREEMLKARQESETKLQRIRVDHGNSEREMVRAAETRLRAERGRLQGEFARWVQAEADARAELEKVEQAQREARQAAEEERKRLRQQAEQRRAQRAESKRAERARLAEAARAAEQRVASAELLNAETQARREELRRALEETADNGVEGRHDDEAAAAMTSELAAFESNAEGTESELRQARALYESANRAQLVAETRSAQEEAAEVELRVRLYEELEEALAAEQEEEREEEQERSTEPMRGASTALEEPHRRRGDVDDPLPEALLEDLKSQLDDETSGDALRAQFFAQRSQLTRAAMAAAAEEKARASADLERARAHLARLREAAAKNKPGEG